MDVRLECQGLSHRFAPGRGLGAVSFAIAGPGLTAVTGANGSGKSTLFRALAGLLRPSGGTSSLTVGGRAYAMADRRHVAGWCSPDLQLYGELTAEENLRFAAETLGLADADGAVQRAAVEAGIDHRLHDRATALSSGLRQRLRLAFAVLADPPLLLLDEPGSHLDDAGFATLTALLARRRRSARVLVATNDAREWNLADERITLGTRGLGDPA